MNQNSKKHDNFYDDLCNKYFERVYRYCKKLVNGQGQLLDFVEECTQNTFLAARKQIPKLMNHPNIEGWLYNTARNLINNCYRSMYIKKNHELFIDDSSSCALMTSEDEFDSLLDETIDVDMLAIELLRKLNENEYNLYMDYYKSNMSILELSKKYEISSTAVTTRIYRVKAKIKMIAHGYFEEKKD